MDRVLTLDAWIDTTTKRCRLYCITAYDLKAMTFKAKRQSVKTGGMIFDDRFRKMIFGPRASTGSI